MCGQERTTSWLVAVAILAVSSPNRRGPTAPRKCQKRKTKRFIVILADLSHTEKIKMPSMHSLSAKERQSPSVYYRGIRDKCRKGDSSSITGRGEAAKATSLPTRHCLKVWHSGWELQRKTQCRQGKTILQWYTTVCLHSTTQPFMRTRPVQRPSD